RLGFGSKMVVTGDKTQIDLPKGVKSGLVVAEQILQNVNGIGFVHLEESDVVRHPLVGKIIHAYGKQVM
ncbi:PhoH family protein, partial [Vibrio cholerae]